MSDSEVLDYSRDGDVKSADVSMELSREVTPHELDPIDSTVEINNGKQSPAQPADPGQNDHPSPSQEDHPIDPAPIERIMDSPPARDQRDSRNDSPERTDSRYPTRPRSGRSERPVDHQGLTTSSEEPQKSVVYEVKQEPSFHITRALFIANLRRPLSAIHFQNFLKDLADQAGGYIIERAWLNRTRSHGIVLVDKEEGATFIREKLLGSLYPSAEEDDKLRSEFEAREKDRFGSQMREYEEELARTRSNGDDESSVKQPPELKQYSVDRFPLYVDYIPVKALNQWVFEEDKGPRNGEWKIEYENRGDDIIATHTLLNGDFIPRYFPNARRGGRERSRGRGDYRGGRGDYRGGDRGDYRGDYRDGDRGDFRGSGSYYRRDNYYPGRGQAPSQGRRGGRGYDNSYADEYDNGGYNESENSNGPRPYHVYPPRNTGRGGNQRSYNRGGDRDFYIPQGRDQYHSGRTDSYQPSKNRSTGRSRSRSRSRSPIRSSARSRSRSPVRSTEEYRRTRSRSP